MGCFLQSNDERVGIQMSSLRLVGISLLASLVLFPLQAAAWDRGEVERFATLPAGNANPEGITADKSGNIYVTTFAPTAPAGTLGQLIVFDREGRLVRQVSVQGSSPALLG